MDANETWESELAAMKLSDSGEKLAWEARARVTWGDGPESVQAWLCEQGIDRFAASMIVEACVRERGASVRLVGRRGLWRGLPLAAASTSGMLVLLYFGRVMDGRLFAVLFMAIAFGMIVGLRWTGLALERLFAGPRAPGAVSDLED
jgi:hypothetical protein